MSELFETWNDGDRRSVWVRVREGQHEPFASSNGGGKPHVIVFKRSVRVKVIQEFNARYQRWSDVDWDLDSAVEIPGLWSRIARWFRREPIPAAKVVERKAP